MTAVLKERIVAGWARNAFRMPTYHVHQAEGQSAPESCRRLIQLLIQVQDVADEASRREPLRLALVDARAFAATDSVASPNPRSPLDLTRPDSRSALRNHPRHHFRNANDYHDSDPWSAPTSG